MESKSYPVRVLCRVMQVGKSAYYSWLKRPMPDPAYVAAKLRLHATIKQFFDESRASLGNRMMVKKLRKEGFKIGRYKVRSVMKKLGLFAQQRRAYRTTTKRRHSDAVASNLINQNFNPAGINEVWAGDVTYIKTTEGWMYLAIVMDLFSRKIVGWALDKHMKTSLIADAFRQAYILRKPESGLIFHSDRGSQYTSKEYRDLLKDCHVKASMGDVGACWDNAVVERFFGSLKYDWIFKNPQSTRANLRKDVASYIRYYNLERLHTYTGFKSPVDYENEFRNAA